MSRFLINLSVPSKPSGASSYFQNRFDLAGRAHKDFYLQMNHGYRQRRNSALAHIIADLVRLHTGKEVRHWSVLEYGCNTGYTIAEFAAMGNTAVGVDVFRDAIDFAQSQHAAQVDLRYEVVGEALPFPDDSFDLVFSSEVFEHTPIPHRQRYLDEFRRVLKPNGVGYLSYPNFWFPLEQHCFIPFHHWLQRFWPRAGLVYEDIPTRRLVRSLLRPSFNILDVTYEFLSHPRLRESQRMLLIHAARWLSRTPLALQDYLLLFPKQHV